MITAASKPAVVERSHEFVEYKSGVSAEGLPFLLNILRNQIYSDKILAVVREYLCNALDAHVEAGCPDRPVEITLPTTFHPTLHIRDFGLGLSEAQIDEIYIKYCASTKRNSNTQIGAFGIGSKSGFAYGDNFVVTTFYGGRKKIFNCYLGEDRIGDAALMADEPWDGETGIEIQVPVKEADIPEFHRKVAHFLRFCEVEPLAVNLDSTYVSEVPALLLEGKGWKLRKSGARYVVMGSVAYPFVGSQVALTGLAYQLAQLPIELYVEIGECDIAASREALEYTERTKAALIAKLEATAEEMVQQVEDRLAAAQTLWEARCLYGELTEPNSGLPNQLISLVKNQGLDWQGTKIDTRDIDVGKVYGLVVKRVFDSHVQLGFKADDTTKIQAGRNVTLFVNDTGVGYWSSKRMETWFANKAHELCYILNFQDPKTEAELRKLPDFDGVKFVPLSTVPKATPVRISHGSSRTVNPKHSARVFSFNPDKAGKMVRSEAWKLAEVDLEEDEGVWVSLYGFEPVGIPQLTTNTGLQKLLEEVLVKAKLPVPDVVGVKQEIQERFATRDNWTSLTDYVKDQLRLRFELEEERQRLLDQEVYAEHYSSWKGYTSVRKELKVPSGLMKRYLDALFRMRVRPEQLEEYNTLSQLLITFGLKEELIHGEPSYDLAELFQEMLTRYTLVGNNPGHFERQPMVDYLNLVDRALCPAAL
jgi:hypothetical protein